MKYPITKHIKQLVAVIYIFIPFNTNAATLFSDDFSDSGTSSSHWNVIQPTVEFINSQMELSGTGIVQTLTYDLTGITDVTISFDWMGVSTESSDTLVISVGLNGVFNTFVTQELSQHIWTTSVFSEASWDNVSSVSFSFGINANIPTESVHIDNVVLSGISTIVPIPPTVWLFGSGLIGLIGIARRKKS